MKTTIKKFGEDVSKTRAKARETNAKLTAEAAKTKAVNVKRNATEDAAAKARSTAKATTKKQPTSLFGRADAMSPRERAEYKRATGE